MDPCTICLESLDTDAYTLNCQHAFHKKCVTEWLQQNNNCPLCRTIVQPDDRYVTDHIISPERNAELQQLVKNWILLLAKGAEILFPEQLSTFGDHIQNNLESGQYDALVSELAQKYNNPENVQSENLSPETKLLLSIGLSAFSLYNNP